MTITPTKPGQIINSAEVATDSTDATSSNDDDNVTLDVYRPVVIDIQPRGTPNSVNITKGGVVPVAILSTSTFAATSLNVATKCFGDAEAPSQRTCVGKLSVQDVNKDKRQDLMFQFEAKATGIEPWRHHRLPKGHHYRRQGLLRLRLGQADLNLDEVGRTRRSGPPQPTSEIGPTATTSHAEPGVVDLAEAQGFRRSTAKAYRSVRP